MVVGGETLLITLTTGILGYVSQHEQFLAISYFSNLKKLLGTFFPSLDPSVNLGVSYEPEISYTR